LKSINFIHKSNVHLIKRKCEGKIKAKEYGTKFHVFKKYMCVHIKSAHCVLYVNIRKQHILVIVMNSKDRKKIQTQKEREGERKRSIKKD
jgi:hypothetical protein